MPRQLPGYLLALALTALAATLACGPETPALPTALERDGGMLSKKKKKNENAEPEKMPRKLVRCLARHTVTAAVTIGPKGGKLSLGKSSLTVPPGALDTEVLITGHALPGDVAKIAFEPAGLRFSKSVTLTLDTKGCEIVPLDEEELEQALYLAYVAPDGTMLERIRATYSAKGNTASAPIRHFSAYALAW